MSLLIYCIFSYLFMGAYAWDILTIKEPLLLIVIKWGLLLISPLLMPIMLGQMLADNEIK